MLKGKTADYNRRVVRGIGKCNCRDFLQNGANVIICDISSPEAAAATEEELKAFWNKG